MIHKYRKDLAAATVNPTATQLLPKDRLVEITLSNTEETYRLQGPSLAYQFEQWIVTYSKILSYNFRLH
jgi:hypothetical protein